MARGFGGVRPPSGSSRRTFTAKFDSECSACMNWILKGDEAVYDEFDEVVHAECAGPVDLDRPPTFNTSTRPKEPPVCPECHTAHVGECM
jgi:hypothetical protein